MLNRPLADSVQDGDDLRTVSYLKELPITVSLLRVGGWDDSSDLTISNRCLWRLEELGTFSHVATPWQGSGQPSSVRESSLQNRANLHRAILISLGKGSVFDQ